MKYENRFQVEASLESVNAFHRSASSLKAITPPFFFMSNMSAPDHLTDGDEFAFTLWLGPIPLHWQVRVENFHPNGFDDLQLKGPFASWRHAHRFEALDEQTTLVLDTVEYSLRRHWIWGPIGLFMAAGLPILFLYRGFRTRSLLNAAKQRSRR